MVEEVSTGKGVDRTATERMVYQGCSNRGVFCSKRFVRWQSGTETSGGQYYTFEKEWTFQNVLGQRSVKHAERPQLCWRSSTRDTSSLEFRCVSCQMIRREHCFVHPVCSIDWKGVADKSTNTLRLQSA